MRLFSSVKPALREFAIVVAGVLVALAAQAWWEGRVEKRRERDYLRQLYVDVLENEVRLNEAIRDDSVSRIATDKALTVIDGGASSTPPDSVVKWIRRAGASADFRPLIGTFNALIGTGDLRLIRDDSLRTMLIGYAATIEAENERTTQIRGAVIDLVPTLASSMPFMRTIFLDGPDAARLNLKQLQADSRVAVSLFTLQAANVNRVSGFQRQRRATHALRAKLEQHIRSE